MRTRRHLIVAVTLLTALAMGLGGLQAGAPDERSAGLAPLPRDVETGWQRYLAAVEARQGREVASAHFLALDHLGARGERRRVLDGDTVIAAVPSPRGVSPDLDGAAIHHWRGATFVRGTTVARLVAALETAPPAQPDVLRARVLDRGPEGMRVYLRIRRSQVVTVVYDTEHRVRFHLLGSGRAMSSSQATRIVEVAEAGTSAERPLPHDQDRDFLWRLEAHWRYQDVPGGVLAECESVSLSRDVPVGLGLVARPFIQRAAESSMRAALLALRD